MSELRADTITASDGTSPVTLTKQSPSKFRVHHSGDSPTTNESFNMSGLTDNGAGDYTYAFTNNFNTVYFSTVAMSTEDGTIGYVTMYYDRSYTRSASNVRLQGIDETSSFEDGAYTSAVAHGDLA
jgi:hypothetical protein